MPETRGRKRTHGARSCTRRHSAWASNAPRTLTRCPLRSATIDDGLRRSRFRQRAPPHLNRHKGRFRSRRFLCSQPPITPPSEQQIRVHVMWTRYLRDRHARSPSLRHGPALLVLRSPPPHALPSHHETRPLVSTVVDGGNLLIHRPLSLRRQADFGQRWVRRMLKDLCGQSTYEAGPSIVFAMHAKSLRVSDEPRRDRSSTRSHEPIHRRGWLMSSELLLYQRRMAADRAQESVWADLDVGWISARHPRTR